MKHDSRKTIKPSITNPYRIPMVVSPKIIMKNSNVKTKSINVSKVKSIPYKKNFIA